MIFSSYLGREYKNEVEILNLVSLRLFFCDNCELYAAPVTQVGSLSLSFF